MDEIAKQFGLCVSLSARKAVMKDPTVASPRRTASLAARHRDSLCQLRAAEKSAKNISASMKLLDDFLDTTDMDDNTVSTVNDDDSFSTTSSGDGQLHGGVVTFATPLVTATFERPRTSSPEEKASLYYTDAEYREFKRAYFFRQRDVQIHDRVVTDVWEIPVAEEPSELYYSESDLQG